MIVERQDTFKWWASIDVFLGGAGGGVFFVSFIMNLLNKYEALARIGAVAGVCLVLIGATILFADLGVKSQLLRLLSNLSSWMSRGTWIIMVFIIFGLSYSLPSFWFFAWKATLQGKVIGVVAAIFSVLAILYTGFLFSVIKRIPLWNTGALPLVFFFSSLCCGMAILLLIAPFITLGDVLYTLVILTIVAILVLALVLWIFLETASHGNISATKSVHLLLKAPLFIFMVIIVGLTLPFALLSYSAIDGNISFLPFSAGIFLLIGNFTLRYCILTAGVRLPLYVL